MLLAQLVVAAIAFATPALSFNNILVVLFENTNYEKAIADPNFKAFANSGILYSNWKATTHPSRPNYYALATGSTNGLNSDSQIIVTVPGIVDLLEAKHLTWKDYQENYPGNCYTKATSSDHLWAEKHDPFIGSALVRNNKTRCANILPATSFASDIANKPLPNFVWYTPNLNNDAHDTTVTFAGTWFKNFLSTTQVVSRFDVVFVTFDESQPDNDGNHVFTAIAGKAVKSRGRVDSTALNHYSLLKTLENNFGLGNLGKNDVGATAFTVV